MKMMKYCFTITFLCAVFMSCGVDNSNNLGITKIHNMQILKDWKLKSSTQVSENGSMISSSDFITNKWLNIKVPTTVLRALVGAGIYPDPHLDLNNFLIPDASDKLNEQLDLAN
jgi:transglutaminase/protease-like cytokinesis protein 3